MKISSLLILAGSALLLLNGVVTLIITWTAPNLLDRPFVRSALIGRRLAPTRKNYTLVAVCSILLALFFISLFAHIEIVGFIAFAGWAFIRLIYLRQR